MKLLACTLLVAYPMMAQPVSTVAGTGERTFSGDGGPALREPAGVAVDSAGNLYFPIAEITACGRSRSLRSRGREGIQNLRQVHREGRAWHDNVAACFLS